MAPVGESSATTESLAGLDEKSGVRLSPPASLLVRSSRPLWIERTGTDPVQLLCLDGSSATLRAGRYVVRTAEGRGAIVVAAGTDYELSVRPVASTLRAAGVLVAATGAALCAAAAATWQQGMSPAWVVPSVLLVAAGAVFAWRSRVAFDLRACTASRG
jgi:hypothetical protein